MFFILYILISFPNASQIPLPNFLPYFMFTLFHGQNIQNQNNQNKLRQKLQTK